MDAAFESHPRCNRRRRFILVLFLLTAGAALIPPITADGFAGGTQSFSLALDAMAYPTWQPGTWAPALKLAPLVLAGFAMAFGRIGQFILSVYVVFNYGLVCVHQGIGWSERSGLVIVVGNLVVFLVAMVGWASDVVRNRNSFEVNRWHVCRLWCLPLALFALLYPLNPETAMPAFDLRTWFYNDAGVSFCTVTPFYVGLLVLWYPRVNSLTLACSASAGLVAAVINVYANFISDFARLWCNGVLHLPLLIVCSFGLWLLATSSAHPEVA